MSRLECERWANLLDRQAIEGALSAEEARFQPEHVRSCAACASELAAWRELRRLDPAQTSPLERDVLLEDTVLKKLWSDPPVPRARAGSSRRRQVFIAGALAVAAAVAAYLLPSRRGDPPTTRAVANVTIGAGSAIAEGGALRRLGELVRPGETLRAGPSPTCLLIEPGVKVCLAPDGEFRLADAAVAHRRIDLLHGHLVATLDPQPTGTTFSVSTPAGVVTAIGTIFSVEVLQGSEPVKVRVLRGSVKVHTSDAQERTLRDHQSLAFGLETPTDIPAGEEAKDLALLRVDTENAPEPSEPPESSPASTAGGQTPETPVPTSARSPASPEPAAAGDLLRQALDLRARSRFTEAADVYRKLGALHPGSPEARAALVSLGDLQLSRLHDPAGALRSFDAYLASGDRTLEQEAEYGRIRALRTLGRTIQERDAIEHLLLGYPSGVHAEPMRARLQSLKGDAGR
jgi:ferric-dicitrate binding protein FerR (iron transport regulator)